jgi:1-acyl-sn-glycerol-3-phosphate acyltransferase
MKKEIAKVPVIGIGSVFYGCIPLDRKNLNARKEAGLRVIKQIETSVSTVTFPEGTRSKTGVPKEKIHPGLIKAAYLKKIPVLPLVLKNTHEILNYSKKPLRIKRGVHVELEILPPVNPRDFETSDAFIEATWGKIRSTYQNTQPNS